MVLNIKDKDRLIKRDVFEKPVDAGINPPREPAAQLYTTGRTTPEDFVGSSESVYTHNDSQGAVKDEMNVNSKLWWDAKAAGDTEWMKSLEAANQQLAALLGDGVKFTPSTGKWSGVADVPASTQASMNTGVSVKQPTYDYNEWAASNPQPTYQSAYDAEIDALMNQLLNREKFSYDAESDPLFQQYKNIYSREGNRSMNDTLAAAASGAGGMSSYAMTAAQQANNYYMAQLGDKIPELKQLAYDMYLNDLDLQRQDVGMLMDMENMDYGRYRDSMSDWQNDRSFGYNMYRDQMGDYKWGTEFNYGASRDAIADQRYDQEWQHQLEREAIADQRYDTEWEYGVGRDQIADQRYDQEWQYGLTRDQIEDAWREKQFNYGVSQDQLANEWKQKQWDYETSLDGWGDDPEDVPADDPEEENKFWSSVNNLGLGPVNASFVLELAEYGGIVENADGTVKWASGWNARNFEEKLKQAKGTSAFDFLPGF